LESVLSGGGYHSSNKRQRESDRAQKKEEKARRRAERRERGPTEIPVVTASSLQVGIRSTEEAMRAIEQGAQQSRAAATIPSRLFVGGLSPDTDENDLREAFSAVGRVSDVVVVRDRMSGRQRGFGFVTLADRKHAPRAIELLNGSELRGHRIAVNAATERGSQ
jgi:hypothetical protein